MRTRAQGARRRTVVDAQSSPKLARFSLEELRRYRAGLAAEEDRASYWRRLVHARLDILREGARADGVLTLEQLTQVLGDTGTGRMRRALVAIRPEEPLPDLPDLAALSAMWVTEIDPHDEEQVAGATRELTEAEGRLTAYRQALHVRIDEATAELIVRYRADPASALRVLEP